MHISIPMNVPCEFINIVPLNPLISKCQIKVCYVGQDPNRNGSIITKEVARTMANSLPGSPIVGFFDETTGDFDTHNHTLEISNGKLITKDKTKPYGFVDLGAKVWFQWFMDDGVQHEYLVTEGFLWTGQYPECQRVITKGNNQSMELDEEKIDAEWAKIDKDGPEFFIINEAIISKLCILGENTEPCFEGSQIKTHFSFDDNFKNELYSMMNEIRFSLEGGVKMSTISDQVEEVTTETQFEEEDKKDEEEICPKCGKPLSECKCDKTEHEVKKCPKCGKPLDECECEEEEEKEEDKKDKYDLNEISEYMELKASYDALQEQYNSLKSERDNLFSFKAKVEKQQKEDMIKSFYMLSDEDKKDVIDNIDTYSLNDIEAKLSIICVRNRVNFDLEKNKTEEKLTYSIQEQDVTDCAPAWIKAVRKAQNKI